MGPLAGKGKIISFQIRVGHFGRTAFRFGGIFDARLNVVTKVLKHGHPQPFCGENLQKSRVSKDVPGQTSVEGRRHYTGMNLTNFFDLFGEPPPFAQEPTFISELNP
jgi:hypothetical protein